METDSSSIDSDANTQRISLVKKDAIAEKQKLLQDIKELKYTIKQLELQDTLCFKDIEEHVTKLQIPRYNHLRRIPNIEADLQNELHNFAGFNCVKYHRNEIVFNFTTPNKLQENNTYAVQIFIKDGKSFLGKWVMPMSIDMNNILTKTPIDKIENINVFLKNCQHHINCYLERQEQYLKLKKHTSHIKHCKLHFNTGYTQINLEMYGIKDTQKNECLNLIIYIIYHSDEARPYKIEVDTIHENKLSSDRKQRFKVCLKPFKTLELTTAFDQMLAEDSEFIWMKTDDSDSSMELNDISSSDEEGFLGELLSNQKRLRKAKKKRKLQNKWKKIKRQKGTSSFTTTKNVTLSEDNVEDNRSKAKASVQKQNLERKKKVEEVASTSNLKETTPFKQPEDRLKQTKLNFHTVQATSSDSTSKNLVKSKLHNKPGKSRTAKLITSTPLIRTNINTRSLSSSFNIGSSSSISDIEKSKENSNDFKMNLRPIRHKSTSKRKSARLSHSINYIE
nr:PREDICTED: uncharacterized protein LOC105667299 [Linepithema humile]